MISLNQLYIGMSDARLNLGLLALSQENSIVADVIITC